MNSVSTCDRRERLRNLHFMGKPSLWQVWPFLPLVRRKNGHTDECGLLFDVFHVNGQTGFSSSVLLCNLFELPSDLPGILALPKEVYDTIDEVFDGGWRVD